MESFCGQHCGSLLSHVVIMKPCGLEIFHVSRDGIQSVLAVHEAAPAFAPQLLGWIMVTDWPAVPCYPNREGFAIGSTSTANPQPAVDPCQPSLHLQMSDLEHKTTPESCCAWGS